MENPYLLILIDHQNIPQSSFSFERVLTSWLVAMQGSDPLPAICDVGVRAYGGWFEGEITSAERYAAADYYQQRCPAILRIGTQYFRFNFAFADELISPYVKAGESSTSIRISHTVGLRTTKKDLTFARSAATCTTKGCEILALRRWSRNKRACTQSNCPHEFALVAQRKEQKQVDVHLSVDLVLAVMPNSRDFHPFVAVVSDDLDLVPAVVAATIASRTPERIAVVRHQQRPSYLDGALIMTGAKAVNVAMATEARQS